MSSSKLPILFSFWRSSCSWRVRIALNLKAIPFQIEPVDILKDGGEQYRKEFGEINPMRHVPALQIDGITLIDSLNILHYLEETRPEKPLLPDDLVQRARMREICHIIVSGIQPLQNTGVLNYLEEFHVAQNKWAEHWINRGFPAIEKILSKTSGTYCIGDTITLADCCVIPQVYNARRFKVDMEQYPNIVRIEKKLENHPDFVNSHPSQQPDCPMEFRA